MNKLNSESFYQNEPLSPSNDQSIEEFRAGGDFDLDNVFFDNNNAMKDDIKQQMGRNESILTKKRRKTTVPKLTQQEMMKRMQMLRESQNKIS